MCCLSENVKLMTGKPNNTRRVSSCSGNSDDEEWFRGHTMNTTEREIRKETRSDNRQDENARTWDEDHHQRRRQYLIPNVEQRHCSCDIEWHDSSTAWDCVIMTVIFTMVLLLQCTVVFLTQYYLSNTILRLHNVRRDFCQDNGMNKLMMAYKSHLWGREHTWYSRQSKQAN